MSGLIGLIIGIGVAGICLGCGCMYGYNRFRGRKAYVAPPTYYGTPWQPPGGVPPPQPPAFNQHEEGMTFVGNGAGGAASSTVASSYFANTNNSTPSPNPPQPNGPPPQGTAVYPGGAGHLSASPAPPTVPSPRPGVAEMSPNSPRPNGGSGFYAYGGQGQGQPKPELDPTNIHEMGNYR